MPVLVELDPDIPHTIKFIDSEYRWKDLIKSLPGSRWTNPKYDDAWRVPLTWQMCLALRTTFGTELVIGPGLAEWAVEYRKRVVEPAIQMRSAVDAELPGYDGLLYPFQRAGVKYLSTIERAILTDGLGAGKTRQALGAVRSLYERGENPFPVLVAAPNSTLISWARESEIIWPGLKVNIIKGPMGKRRKLLEEKAHIYVINWEGLRAHSRLLGYGSIKLTRCEECGGSDPTIKDTACQVHKRELNEIEFNTVIGDEIHRIKDPSSQQTRAFKAATGNARFRIGMSNTPISADPDDLWSPLNWLLPESYPSHTKYAERFLETSYNAWGQPTVIGVYPSMQQEFFGGLDPHLRHMPKEIVLPFLPPIVRERRDVEMSPKQRKAYDQMKKQMIAELDDNELMITTSPLVKMTRLLQFSSSYAELEWREVLDKKTGQMKRKAFALLKEPSCKLDAFMDDLDDFKDESVVVFAVSSQLINLLAARMDKKKIRYGLITGAQSIEERQEAMDAFQAGDIKYILCTIAAGGTGITLTKASTMVFLQRSWSMIENRQAEGRAHRIGSEQHAVIKIIDYVSTDSSELVVHSAVEQKGDQLERILRSKEMIRKALEDNDVNDIFTTPLDLPPVDDDDGTDEDS